VSGYTIGAFIHVLLVIALALFWSGCWAAVASSDGLFESCSRYVSCV
jgi:hypothetical protein